MSHPSKKLVLSPRAQRAGGELARIMSDSQEIARYASTDVKRKTLRNIGDLVESHPRLNTEQGVGGLIWLASFHGESIGKWVEGLTNEYSLDEIVLVIDYLHDSGERFGGNSPFAHDNREVREYVLILLELLQDYKDLDDEEPIRTSDQLYNLIYTLGGLRTVKNYDSPALLAEALLKHRHKE